MKQSLSAENYLKALFHLAGNDNSITVKDLSASLDVRMPSVNSMMKRFAKEGWVIYESYKPLILTDKGRQKAAGIVRKHRLTEMFLVERMGFEWDQVHEIAEQVEHIQSDLFFDRIDQMLNYPKTDPHGSPIPQKDGTVQNLTFPRLSECITGDLVEFVALSDSSDEFLRFLNQKELRLGTMIEILRTEDFDGSKKLKYHEKEEYFSDLVLQKILVRKR